MYEITKIQKHIETTVQKFCPPLDISVLASLGDGILDRNLKVLIAHMRTATDHEYSDRIIRETLALSGEDWRPFVLSMLTIAAPTTMVVRTVSAILAVRLPSHPLGVLSGQINGSHFVFDAKHADGIATFTLPYPLREGTKILFLDFDDPLSGWMEGYIHHEGVGEKAAQLTDCNFGKCAERCVLPPLIAFWA